MILVGVRPEHWLHVRNWKGNQNKELSVLDARKKLFMQDFFFKLKTMHFIADWV